MSCSVASVVPILAFVDAGRTPAPPPDSLLPDTSLPVQGKVKKQRGPRCYRHPTPFSGHSKSYSQDLDATRRWALLVRAGSRRLRLGLVLLATHILLHGGRRTLTSPIYRVAVCVPCWSARRAPLGPSFTAMPDPTALGEASCLPTSGGRLAPALVTSGSLRLLRMGSGARPRRAPGRGNRVLSTRGILLLSFRCHARCHHNSERCRSPVER